VSDLDQAVARVRECLARYHAARKVTNDTWIANRDAQEAEQKANDALFAARQVLRDLVEGREP